VTPQGNTPQLDALITYLHTRKILLVLDNCEHLIEACAPPARRARRAGGHRAIRSGAIIRGTRQQP
jgi:predicted ATPase